jgi:hypothetical protein
MQPRPPGLQTAQGDLRNGQGQPPQGQRQQHAPNQQQLQQATASPIARFAPALPVHVGAQQGNRGGPGIGQDRDHSAPATANPPPHLLTNGNYNPTQAGVSPTNASGANTPALTYTARAAASPHNSDYPAGGPPSAVNGILRPNSTRTPGLFGNLESTGAGGPESFADFERDFGQWFDPN